MSVSGVSVTAHKDCWKISYTPAYYGMPYKNPGVTIACRSLAETKIQISPKPHFYRHASCGVVYGSYYVVRHSGPKQSLG